MNRIKYKRLKLLAFVCIIILVIEVFYISYCLVYKNRESRECFDRPHCNKFEL